MLHVQRFTLQYSAYAFRYVGGVISYRSENIFIPIYSFNQQMHTIVIRPKSHF